MKKLLIATSNPAKFEEISRFLSDLPLEVVKLTDIGVAADAPEDGDAFEDIAIAKARYYCSRAGLPTIADDGGFEIDALGGAPGVRSHRWVDPSRDASDEELIQYTMKQMEGVPEAERGAGLRVVLAFATPDSDDVYTETAAVRGIVAPEPSPKRKDGFPYRSLLYLPEIRKFYDHDELTDEETEEYNHRKRALERLKPIIVKILC